MHKTAALQFNGLYSHHPIKDTVMSESNRLLPATVDLRSVETPAEKINYLKSFRGIIMAIASGVFMSLTSAIVKKVDVFPGELGLIRFVTIAVFALPLAIYSQTRWFGNRTLVILLLVRGCLDTFSIYFRFQAIQRLPLADATVIIFTSPVLVAIMARFVLKEPCRIMLIVSLFLTLLGLVLVVKLPLINSSQGSLEFNSWSHIMGVVYGLGSVFFNASMFVVVRKIRDDLHRTIILFHLGWTASIVSVVITGTLGNFTMPDPVKFEPWWLILIGLLSFFGQLLLTASLQYEHAGPVSIARAGSDIVSTFVWQAIFFGNPADLFSIAGAFLVTFGGVVLNLNKWLETLPDTSRMKKTLNVLLK